jgi:uncharacterized protein YvpB
MKTYYPIIIALLISSVAFSQHFATGLVFDDDAYAEIPAKPKNVAFFDNLADVSRASLKQYVPIVKSQDQYGTCTGWATAYYGRTIIEAKQLELSNQEEINNIAFSPLFTYLNVAKNKINCQKGSSIHLALNSLKNDGSPYFKDYGVLCDDTIPETVTKKAKANVIENYNRIITGTEPPLERIENVKRALYNGNPVVIGFSVEKALHITKNVYIPDGQSTGGGHAMCVIGFDDEKYGGSFEIVNSWGTNWGNNGFFWVKYTDFVNLTKYALEIIPKPKAIEDNYQTLAGELRLELKGGKPMVVAKSDTKFKKTVLGWQDIVAEEETDKKTLGDYRTKDAYPKETKYRIYAKVDQPSYMYVFYADSSGENGIIFPHEKENVSAYFDNTEAELVMPGEKYMFRLNSDVDSDYTIIVFSLEELDTESIVTKMNMLEGELMDKLYLIFNDKLIDKENITLEDHKMKFNSKFKKGSLAMMVLDIKRN